MRSQFILLSLVILYFNLQSQELLVKRKIDKSKDISAYPLLSISSEKLYYLIIEKNKGTVLIFNESMEDEKEIAFQYDSGLFKEFQGSVKIDNQLFLYFMEIKHRKMLTLCIDLISGSTTMQQQTILGSKDRYLTSFSDNENMIILSSVKNKSILKCHLSAGNSLPRIIEFNFSNQYFYKSEFTANLDQLIKPSKTFAKIYQQIPTNIIEASYMTKAYLNDKKIFLTVDYLEEDTFVIILDLVDQSSEVKTFMHIDAYSRPDMKSNSFLHQNILYQINTDHSEVIFSLTDINSRENIKTFRISKTDSLNSNNYVVTKEREDGFYGKHTISFSKPKKVVRNISRLNPSIFVSSYSEDYIALIVGGYKHTKNSGGMLPNGSGGFVSYGGTYYTNQIQFLSFLKLPDYEQFADSNFITPYSRINSFAEKLEDTSIVENEPQRLSKVLISEKIFQFDNEMYFGYYEYRSSYFYLYKFPD